jgi:hypothetical protein
VRRFSTGVGFRRGCRDHFSPELTVATFRNVLADPARIRQFFTKTLHMLPSAARLGQCVRALVVASRHTPRIALTGTYVT